MESSISAQEMSKMNKKLPFLAILILVAAGFAVWFFAFRHEIDPDRIMVSGNIELTEVQLGFKIPGRLEARFVNEGDMVVKGDIIARLENRDQKILVSLARADLARARSMLAELEAGNRPEEIALARAQVEQARQAVLELTRGSRIQDIKKARSDLDAALSAELSAKTELDQAKKDYERFAALYRKKSISQRDFELFRTKYEVARNAESQAGARVAIARQILSLVMEGPRQEQIKKARAALEQAKARYDLISKGPRKEKIDQAKIMVNQAEAKLEQAENTLSYTTICAPMTGIVLSKSAEPGEYLNPGTPVITIGDIHHPWLRAYVTEKNLGRIRQGTEVMVTTDSFPGKSYKGKISFISSQAEFTPKSVQTFEERVKLMFRIKIDLKNPDGELKAGMPADGIIRAETGTK